MNLHLQNILDSVQQNEKISAEEKDILLKTLKKADNDFTISEFKLDRTEKVKRTTAILLEETIDELEQKRKAVESQNRELEIEKALEKVRSAALAMKELPDMVDVCHIISDQLELLGVKEIRNVQTAIFYVDKGTYFNYEFYRLHDKALITEVEYINHPMSAAFANQMLKGPEEFFARSLDRKELEEWYAFQQTTNQFVDTHLAVASSLNYYWCSMGPVALGISTYVILTEEEINLFKRFRNVFELAYRRFLDIEKAMAQSREAQTELALERVRAKTMAMQHSNDLADTASILFQQIKGLGFNTWSCGFCTWQQNDIAEVWMGADSGGLLPPMMIPYKKEPTHHDIYKASLTGADAHEKIWEGKQLNKHYDFLRSIPSVAAAIKQLEDAGLSLPTKQCYYIGFFKQGYLLLITKEPNAEMHDISIRFAKVFEQTYTRFLDLQKAEAQAREAQIELALERVRARTMAMQKSEELPETSYLLFQQLKELGASADQLSIGILNEAEQTMDLSVTLHGSQLQNTYTIKLDEPFVVSKSYAAWKANKKSIVITLTGKDLEEYNAYRNSLSKIKFNKTDADNKWVVNCAFFSKGWMSFSSLENVPAETIKLLERFTAVFDGTYTRFLDLQKAEAQAREAQIEAAVERVRAQSMAMQLTTDFDKVNKELLEQLKRLQVQGLTGVSFYFFDDDGEVRIYDLSSPGNIGNPNSYTIKFSSKKYPVLGGLWQEYKIMEDYIVLDYPLDTLKLAVKEFKKIDINVANALTQAIKSGTLTHQWLAFAKISGGGLGIDLINSPVEDTKTIAIKMAGAFNLAYQRFLDLQKAEAQAREAQINLAVERVRARALAMYKSDEILEVVFKLKEEVMNLNIPGVAAATIHLKEKNGMHRMWDLSSFEQDGEKMHLPLDIIYNLEESDANFYIRKIWGNAQKYFLVKQDRQDLKITTDWLRSNGKVEQADEADQFLDSIDFTFLYHPTIQLNNGRMSIDLLDQPPSGEMESILTKMGAAFDLAYKRFEDLKNSEAQLKEAQIEAALEKVRSRSLAMHKSDEIGEVVWTVVDKMKELNVELNGISLVTYIPDSKDTLHWHVNPEVANNSASMLLPYFDDLICNDCFQAKEEGIELFSKVYTKEQKDSYFNKAVEVSDFKYFPEELKQLVLAQPCLSFSFAIQNHSGIFLEDYSGKIFTKEENDILIRFSRVFEQSYVRFLDLQKAESQAREAEIELALERVRARTMAMQHSYELADASLLLDQQIRGLGIKTRGCAFNIYGKKESTEWFSNEMGTMQTYKTPREKTFLDYYDAGQKGETLLIKEFSGKECVDWYNYLCTLPVIGDGLKEMIANEGSFPTRQIDHVSFFKYGYLLFLTFEPVPQAHDIFIRFAKVFEQTYTRFLDLQKAEASAREAQIEAGLEKVRSRTLAMQKSDELADTSIVIFEQLINLGIEPNRLFIGIIKEETHSIEAWATNEDGTKIDNHFSLHTDKNASVNKMYEGWKQKKTSTSIDMQGEELQDYFHYLSDEMHIPFQRGLLQKRRVQTIAYFGQGLIGMASPEEQPVATTQLLERFAAVFNLTYTRFNDLKIAEAHAVQAEQDLVEITNAKQSAEAALVELQATQKQLIQSEKMASLGELTAGIAHEIQNPLNFVNNFSEVSKELLQEMKDALEKGDTEEAKEIMNDVIQNLEKINHHGKRADGIVKGMLQHSRSSSATKEPTDINALCDEYLRLSYHGLRAKDKTFNASIKTDFDAKVEKINIIPQDIGRVVLNLFTNAFYAVNERLRQAKPESGYEPTVSISTKKIGDNVLISVSDNGKGIPQNIVDKIFQPFFTTKPTGQGTGLGLSLSYDIVKAHGGEIKVETKEGEGTTFIIHLPQNKN